MKGKRILLLALTSIPAGAAVRHVNLANPSPAPPTEWASAATSIQDALEWPDALEPCPPCSQSGDMSPQSKDAGACSRLLPIRVSPCSSVVKNNLNFLCHLPFPTP